MKIEETVAALTFVINELTEEIKGLRAEIEELKEMQDMEIVFTPEEGEDEDENSAFSFDDSMDLFYGIFNDTDEDNTEEGE